MIRPTLDITFSSEERAILEQSQWLKDAERRKNHALRGDTKARVEITKSQDKDEGLKRDEILACHDNGLWTYNHLREGRQPEMPNPGPLRGLHEALEDAEDGSSSSHLIEVNANNERQSIVRATRLLVIAAIEKEIGKKAIEIGLLEADQMSDRELSARTNIDDGGETARARLDTVTDLEAGLFTEYLEIEERFEEREEADLDGDIDIHLIKVAIEHELRLLEDVKKAYSNYSTTRKRDGTMQMLNEMNNITIPALRALRNQIREKLGETITEAPIEKTPQKTQQKDQNPPSTEKNLRWPRWFWKIFGK